jgi:hypothetical protein
MRALGWNCQGMGRSLRRGKMTHLTRMIHSTNPQVIFVSEIKSSKVKSSDLVTRFNMADAVVVPSHRRSGGLWLMWNNDLQIHMYIVLAFISS